MTDPIDIPLWQFIIGLVCTMVCLYVIFIHGLGWLLSTLAQWGINRQIRRWERENEQPMVIIDEYQDWRDANDALNDTEKKRWFGDG